ncbi:MAG: ArsR/SmtB family transcription factor [Planctomycetota bacterium]|jgi:ArsR family transcriptional regulator
MKASSKARYEARATVAKALSHPLRLELVDRLQAGEQCVCDLTEALDVDQSVVSKHLTILKNAGLVDCRREGTMSFYRVTAPCLAGFWDCLDGVLKRHLAAQRSAIGG